MRFLLTTSWLQPKLHQTWRGSTAFKLAEKVDDPLAMYLADIYTVTANLAGIPGISIPCGETTEKLPIGMQILGKHFDEATILRIAHAYESSRQSSVLSS